MGEFILQKNEQFVSSLPIGKLNDLSKRVKVLEDSGGAGSSTFIGLTDVPATYTGQGNKFVRVNGAETALEFATVSGGGDALTSAPLSQFAATTSLQLKGVMSDETGSGALVFATSPALVTPDLGTPSALVGTNITGTAAGLTAGTVTTNANLTGGVTSVGNAATVVTNANLTGHVTSVGNAAVLGSFTKAQLDIAVSDGNVLYVGDVTQYTDELAQDAVGAMIDTSLVYVDGTPLLTRAALTGDVTASQGSNATTIANAAVTLAKMANLAQDQFIGRTTASTGVPETATITAAARTVLDDTTVSAMVDTLGGATSTGTGGLVRATSPTLVTPVIGVATATSVNKVAITAPATSSTITVADGKTFTASNTITLTGTDSVSMNVSNNKTAGLVMMIGDGVNNISANATSFFVPCKFAGTITGYDIGVDAGTCTIKTWKKASGTAIPTIADVISTSGVALSTGTRVVSSTTSDFTTTTVTKDDGFIVQATAVSGVKFISFTLEIQKS